jgi:NAD(P)-dependent dehydrogenase (short-subunit alcohol dehydrogenase family)
MATSARLAGRAAIVTGAAGGIGRAVCRRLAEEGAAVLVTGPHLDRVEEVASEIGHRDRLAAALCDVRDAAAVARAVRQAQDLWGGVDIVVNNAGMMGFKPLEQTDDDEWRAILEIDLLGAVRFTREAFRAMRPGGVIVNVASVHAVETTPLVAPYAAAKAALLSLTRSAAIEGKSKGLRANAVVPGAVDTAMLHNNPNLKNGAERLDPTDVGRPEDVAAAVAFLASEDAGFITGAALAVDGGRLAKL